MLEFKKLIVEIFICDINDKLWLLTLKIKKIISSQKTSQKEPEIWIKTY